MNDKLPDNILRFDILKVEYGKRKLCQCENPHYVIDYQNRLVYCKDCGAVLEPLEVLQNLAKNWHRVESRLEHMHEQAKEIQNYKPHLRVFKDLASHYQRDHFSMIPLCPHCNEPFEFDEIYRWVNRGLYPQYKK